MTPEEVGRLWTIRRSAGQLTVARQKDRGAVLVCGNLVNDPQLLAGRQFDLVTANETAEQTWLRPIQIATIAWTAVRHQGVVPSECDLASSSSGVRTAIK